MDVFKAKESSRLFVAFSEGNMKYPHQQQRTQGGCYHNSLLLSNKCRPAIGYHCIFLQEPPQDQYLDRRIKDLKSLMDQNWITESQCGLVDTFGEKVYLQHVCSFSPVLGMLALSVKCNTQLELLTEMAEYIESHTEVTSHLHDTDGPTTSKVLLLLQNSSLYSTS